MAKVISLIDGEHYLPVIKEALKNLEGKGHQILALVLVGGQEKLGKNEYGSLGYPLIFKDNRVAALEEALRTYEVDSVVDLSDEPILGYKERFELANLALLAGVSYQGADFRFSPPQFFEGLDKPSLSIIGLGKRVGKTAISGYLSRELKKEGYTLGVVAMGRGGPEIPEIIPAKTRLSAEFLLAMSNKGKHAASDYFEDALTSGAITIGCRRCGGGMVGAPFISNVLEGAKLANGLEVDILIFEGSGAALPPVKVDACLSVVAAPQPLEYIESYFGPYRLLQSQVTILTQCEAPLASPEKVRAQREAIKRVNPEIKVIETIFRPQPLGELSSKEVFLVTTAPEEMKGTLKTYLEEKFECRVFGISTNLSRPELLEEELLAEKDKYQVLLTELKAAAVDVVTRIGLKEEREVVYTDNLPLVVGGDGDLKEEVLKLAKLAITNFKSRQIELNSKLKAKSSKPQLKTQSDKDKS